MLTVDLFIVAGNRKQPVVLQWVIYTMVYLYHGLLLSKKKVQRTDTCNNLDRSQRNYAE